MQAETPGNLEENLARMLESSLRFDADLRLLLQDGWNTSTHRQVVCMALCKAALEHAISQRVLIEAGLHGTALGLIRLHFETVVRAAWVLYGAKDDWLAKFAEPVPSGAMAEPVLGPPIASMLDAIVPYAPEAERELRQLNQTVKVMHSLVHGGVHLIVHALRGYPPASLISVLQNRNLLSLMLANVIAMASRKPELSGAVKQLTNAHAFCMPPSRNT